MDNSICIIGGCGHVGLPLAVAFAQKGQKVCIFDINKSAIELVKKGKFPFKEEGGENALKEALSKDNLSFSTSLNVISKSKFVIFILGTPVDRHLNPRFDIIKRAMNEYLPYFQDGQIFILRSTVYPSISEKINNYLKSEKKNVHVAFCPERIAQGYALTELSSLPQIVSAFSKKGLEEAKRLFNLLTNDIIVLNPLEAELAKLFTNVWRYISFAIANQFYMIANDYKLDFYKIHEAMTYNYPRAKHFPKAGFAAGPCLLKDTMQLAAFNNNNFFLGHTAMLINEGLPNYIVSKLKARFDLREMKIGVLGMAFKPNNDDKRESLSYKLKKILEIECRQVLCTDVYIKDENFVGVDELKEYSNIIIVGCPHREYRDLSFGNRHVVDIWNFYGKGGII
ncbi:nucleotide sugar dehydrogenase [candidate division KSB1 bacterium]|nr:nucleotide sugar dehydrogenase [candidate division KSB1 bacterium]